MSKRFLQAAILTFLLQLIASNTSPTITQTNAISKSDSTKAPMVVALHRLLESASTRLTKQPSDFQ